ncbi:MAG: efflux RND transporter periplasmic adaptor subunit [Planctomycetota bacterium]
MIAPSPTIRASTMDSSDTDPEVAESVQAGPVPSPNRDHNRKAKTGNGQRDRFRRSMFVIGAAVCVVFVIGIAGLGMRPTAQANMNHSDVPVRKPLLVETISVKPVDSFNVERHYTGTIVARRVSDLSFELSGRLASLHVDEGNRVELGQTLAILDAEDLRAKRRETVATRAQAYARLQELLAGPRNEVIRAANANVERLKAEVRLLQAQKQRSTTLRADRAVSQDELDRHSFGLEANQAALLQGLAQLEELVNGTRQEQIDAQRAVVNQLDAAIERIDVDLRKSELNAPFAGTISRRYADEGKIAQPSETLFTLVEDSALEAWIGLPTSANEPLVIGSDHVVKIEGREFRVKVIGHRPEVDPVTRTRTVILALESDANEQVVHGQIARMQLKQSIKASGFWLPLSALKQGERGLWSCLVAAPVKMQSETGSLPETRERSVTEPLMSNRHQVEQRELEILHIDSDRVLVRGTLSPGEKVIAYGTHRVSTGQTVRTVASPIR